MTKPICPICDTELIFQKTAMVANDEIGFCVSCRGYPLQCFNCGTLTKLKSVDSRHCPNCRCTDPTLLHFVYKDQ